MAIETADKVGNLRALLRAETSDAHDRLDSAMRRAAGWADRRAYADFLTIQYRARQPVEIWLTAHAPVTTRPPPQCPLIARDLDHLGETLPAVTLDFRIDTPDAGCALGAAWVLAGSALGNKSILKELRDAGRGDWPSAFLASRSMLAFWSALRPELEQQAPEKLGEDALRGANAVFAHFISHAERQHGPAPDNKSPKAKAA